MKCEMPILLRCCFCFPLRFGLLVWAYIKQIICLLLFTLLILRFHADVRSSRLKDAIFSVYIIYIIFENVFNAFFIVSAHAKDYKKMRIFYRYSIVVQCVNVALLCLFFGICVYCVIVSSPFVLIVLWYYILAPTFALFLFLLITQTYIIILVRSEFIKLKNNSQFEFVNPTAGEKCTADIDFVKKIPDSV